MTNKTDLRQALLDVRNTLTEDVRAGWNIAIGKRLLDWLELHPVSTLGVYWPIRNEPDLRGIFTELTARGIQLALPVVIDKKMPLKFRKWDVGQPLATDGMGIAAPDAASPEVWPDAVLIPCVGFNTGLIRLGYGGGFYDRTLATGRTGNRPAAIGIAYACAQARFDAEPHDVALDVIVTETQLIEASP